MCSDKKDSLTVRVAIKLWSQYRNLAPHVPHNVLSRNFSDMGDTAKSMWLQMAETAIQEVLKDSKHQDSEADFPITNMDLSSKKGSSRKRLKR